MLLRNAALILVLVSLGTSCSSRDLGTQYASEVTAQAEVAGRAHLRRMIADGTLHEANASESNWAQSAERTWRGTQLTSLEPCRAELTFIYEHEETVRRGSVSLACEPEDGAWRVAEMYMMSFN
jgi:hypothetical protein